MYTLTMSLGSIWCHDMVPADTEIGDVSITAQSGTHIHISGLTGSTVERGGRTLAQADEKTLSAAGDPVIVRGPQPGLRVEVV